MGHPLCHDAARSPRRSFDQLRGPRPPELPRSTVRRIRLRPGRGRAETIEEFPVLLELPTLASRLPGTRYRFVYGAGAPEPDRADFIHAVGKLDTETGDVLWWSAPGCYAGEPVFVPRPDGDGEDDGVLLSVVLDSDGPRSFLLVLDARSLDEVARAEAPLPIPAGLHGSFQPA